MVQTAHITPHTEIAKGENLIALQDFVFESEQAIASRQVLRVRLGPYLDNTIPDALIANVEQSFLLAPDIEAVSYHGHFPTLSGWWECLKSVKLHVPDTVLIKEYRMLNSEHNTEALVTHQRGNFSTCSFRIPVDRLDSEAEALIMQFTNLTTFVLEEPMDVKAFMQRKETIIGRVIYTLGSFDSLFSCSISLDLLLNSFVVLLALVEHRSLSSLELSSPSVVNLNRLAPLRLLELTNTIARGLKALAQLEVLIIPTAMVNSSFLAVIGKLPRLKTLRVRKPAMAGSSPSSGCVCKYLAHTGLSEEDYFKTLEVLDVGVSDQDEIAQLANQFPNARIM